MRRASSLNTGMAIRSATAAATTITTQNRSLWFTCQSKQLEEHKANKGFKSDLWVGDNELKFRGVNVTTENKYLAIQAKLPQVHEVYNISELWNYPLRDELGTPSTHSSVASRKAYSGVWAEELEERAQARGYTNKWWIGAGAVKRDKLSIKKGGRSCLIKVEFPTSVYNLDQLEDPKPILDGCISGGTAKRLFGDDLTKFRQEKKYETGIFFTGSQMAQLGLTGKTSAAPHVAEVSNLDFQMYNLSECENWETFVKERELSNPNPEEPCYLAGNPIKSEFVRARIEALGADTYPTKLWVAHNELVANGLVLKPDARFVDARNVEKTSTYDMWNIDDIEQKNLAMMGFGCFIR